MPDATAAPARSLLRGAVGIAPAAIFAAILVYIGLNAPNFLSTTTLRLVLVQSLPVVLVCAGLAIVVMTGGDDVVSGGIDLSIPATAVLCAGITAQMTANMEASLASALLTAFGAALAVGAINALLVSVIRMTPLLTTLAMFVAVTGITNVVTDSRRINVADPVVLWLRDADVAGVPVAIPLVACVVAALYHLMHRTRLGMNMQAVGGSLDAAAMSGLNADRLVGAVTDRTKAVLVCTPSNPSGKVWYEGELRALYDVAERHDLWVLTDEIYEHMVYDGRHLSPASLDGAYERTVTLSGFSKTFNMTGWRLGYAVAPVPVAEKIGLVNDLTTICAPAPLQHGLAAALPMPDAYYERMLADYTAKRTVMVDALRACGFEADPPEGAYYVLAGLGERLGEPGFEDARTATTTLIETAGVACVPGPSFFADPSDGDGLLRFCYAKEMPVLEEACERLVAAFG